MSNLLFVICYFVMFAFCCSYILSQLRFLIYQCCLFELIYLCNLSTLHFVVHVFFTVTFCCICILLLLYSNKFEFFIWNKTTGSIEEDAKIWSRARVVAGLHGGGLTNIAFLHPSASVIEITPQPSGCVRLCFAAIAFSLNIKYHAFAPSESTAFTCADYRNRRRIQLNGKAIARYVTSVLESESASTEDIQ